MRTPVSVQPCATRRPGGWTRPKVCGTALNPNHDYRVRAHRICGRGASACGGAARWHDDGTVGLPQSWQTAAGWYACYEAPRAADLWQAARVSCRTRRSVLPLRAAVLRPVDRREAGGDRAPAQPRGSGHCVIACRIPGCDCEIYEPARSGHGWLKPRPRQLRRRVSATITARWA